MKENPFNNQIDIPSFFQELTKKIDTLHNEVKSLKETVRSKCWRQNL